MTAESKPFKESARENRRAWIWIMLMVNIVFILLLMTLGIIALRVGDYLPEGTDILFIVGKNPSVEVNDDRDGWDSNKQVDIFSSSYENGEGVTTVASQDGTKVIAPGTETVYRFSMYNSGNMAVYYETDLSFALDIGGEKQKEYVFPLSVRLLSQSGDYIIGSETEWVSVNMANISHHASVLGANSYETFELQLMWEFEGGNDELDTMYGDNSAAQGVSLTLGIHSYAEEHLDQTAQGGISIDGEKKQEYGGTVRILWLVLLMVNIGIMIFYVSWLLNKRLKREFPEDYPSSDNLEPSNE